MSGRRVTTAWFTGARDERRVNVAASTDGGARFGAVTRVDGGQPVGWPAVAPLDDGGVVVAWVETVGAQGELRLRRVGADGKAGTVSVVAQVSPGRSTGIPQMVRTGASLLVAWRAGDRVQTAVVPVPTS